MASNILLFFAPPLINMCKNYKKMAGAKSWGQGQPPRWGQGQPPLPQGGRLPRVENCRLLQRGSWGKTCIKMY